MRPGPRRTKKLIVAFHFCRSESSSAGARWKCDACRTQGLERRRRCGFLPEAERGEARLVWVHGTVGVQECPVSYVRPESLELVERFAVWKASGSGGWAEMNARVADAFQMLEEEVRNGE